MEEEHNMGGGKNLTQALTINQSQNSSIFKPQAHSRLRLQYNMAWFGLVATISTGRKGIVHGPQPSVYAQQFHQKNDMGLFPSTGNTILGQFLK